MLITTEKGEQLTARKLYIIISNVEYELYENTLGGMILKRTDTGSIAATLTNGGMSLVVMPRESAS